MVAQSMVSLVVMGVGFAVEPALGASALYDGDLLGMATIGAGFAAIAIILFFVWVRNHPASAYLALGVPRRWWLHLVIWFAVVYALSFLYGLLAPMFDQEEIPEFMRQAYHSTDYMILLWLGVVIAAPLFEEIFFRGFLYAGWRNSPLRWVGTAILTAALWTIIHRQYGWFELSWIFVLGILLALAREWSRSLWIPIAIHAFNNLLATFAMEVEMAKEAIVGAAGICRFW